MPFPTTGLLPSGGLLDDFNRPDEPLSNSSNWADNWFNLPFGGLNVISNECGNVTGTFASSDWVADTFTDTEVYIDLPDGRLGDIALIARTINRRTATASGYVLVFALTGNAVRIERWTNSDPTVLVTTTQAISAGDSIGFEVIGDTLTAYHKPAAGSWTSILSTTDSTYSGAGGIGIVMSENSTRAENFSGGEAVTEAEGTTGITFTPAGAAQLDRTLSGTTEIDFTVSATAQLERTFSGSTSITFDAQATAAGAIDGVGTSSIAFAATATARLERTLSGALDITFTAEATASKAISAQGSTAIRFTPQGTLSGQIALSGSSSIVFTVSGTANQDALTDGILVILPPDSTFYALPALDTYRLPAQDTEAILEPDTYAYAVPPTLSEVRL